MKIVKCIKFKSIFVYYLYHFPRNRSHNGGLLCWDRSFVEFVVLNNFVFRSHKYIVMEKIDSPDDLDCTEQEYLGGQN